MNFDEAFRQLIGHEGGFQKDPNDRANWTTGKIGHGQLVGTKFGVSAMSYPGLDIENLTLEEAKAIYLRDFWGPAGCDFVPPNMKSPLFSVAVHTSAPKKTILAIQLLQRAAGAVPDGIIGKETLLRVQSADPDRLFSRFMGHYLDYLNNNPEQWARFGRGWAQRVADYLVRA